MDLRRKVFDDISQLIGSPENPDNVRAHYETTGPEIWEQTEGRVTHFFVGYGTCGTITGVARFLEEKNPAVRVKT